MRDHTVDTASARRLAQSQAVSGASIIGQRGGWSVLLRLGEVEMPLGAQREDKPRVWRSLDRCVAFLHGELHISRFDLLDASNYAAAPVAEAKRQDSAERLRRAHAAAAHDQWFRAQVEQGLREANDPNTAWRYEEDVESRAAEQQARWRAVGGKDEGHE